MKLRLTAFAVVVLLGAAYMVSTLTGMAQSDASQSALHEREFHNKIPARLPIKVKAKNLQNEKWARDLEIEVTNNSKKPIYYLGVFLVLPEVISPNGNEIGFPLRYGRTELLDIREPVRPSDVPIEPGDTYVFRIPKENWESWEEFSSKKNIPAPKKVQIFFQLINFGDGTGFSGVGGSPLPTRRSSKASCWGGNSDRQTEMVSQRWASYVHYHH